MTHPVLLYFGFKSVIRHNDAEFCEYSCGFLGGYAVDVGTHMACDILAALAHNLVLLERLNKQAHHRDGVVCAYTEVAGLFAAGGIEYCAVDGLGSSVKITPFLARQPAAVKSVKELLAVLFKNVMKRLLFLARDMV